MATSFTDSRGYILQRTNGDKILAEGTTIPADASTGYSTGCIFIHTNGGSATAIYANLGSATSSDFDMLLPGKLPAHSVLNASAIQAGSTIILLPADTSDPVSGKTVYGRMAVAIDGGSLKYIPLYFA